MTEPRDPDPTGVLSMTTALHELLVSAVEAGFTRKEAFAMVLATMRMGSEGARRGE